MHKKPTQKNFLQESNILKPLAILLSRGSFSKIFYEFQFLESQAFFG